MARQVLENGVVLPAEYSDDWYDDMTSNLTKLDDVIGSDSEKLSSADVGAAALSNNYNDLDNLPTIPTVNDAALTIQKNGVDVQTFTANASSNVTCNITVPTKTSDLTNDSNFVDTSNSAVSSGITSAKVNDYDTHIADTDIHVTTADKNRWDNNTYVFRYSSTALTASSTNSNALLDNTDNLKVGDKVIDSSGVLFSITAIDTQNSTFTIGTALIDLAQDSDVVHKSGNETIAGTKTFGNGTLIVDNGKGSNVHGEIKLNGSRPGYIVADNSSDGVFNNAGCGISILLQDENKPLHIGAYKTDANGRVFANNTNKLPVLSITSNLIKTSTLVPENDTVNPVFRILSELNYANGNPSKTLDVRFIQYDDASGSNAIYSNDDGKTSLGATTRRWNDVLTYKVNGLEPSSLGMPDLNNGIDISSYITHLDKVVNNYTPPANGWLNIRVKKTSLVHTSLMMYQTGGLVSSCETDEYNISGTNLPVIANKNVEIYIYANVLVEAKFYPCQGNV